MLSESDKTADHEMCTSDHGPFHCVRFASVRSVTTTLSGESGAAIWHRSDRDRKGFDPTFCKTSGCYSAKIRAVSATNTEAFACVIKAFSPVFSCVRTKSRRRFCRLKRRFELRLHEIAGGARAFQSRCQHHHKREAQCGVCGVEFRVVGTAIRAHSHLRQNRDPIANLGNRHGGPIRYETDFNAHIDPLIFIVPVGLDGVDIDRELPRRVLYAYDLRSY